ncbi:MAG: hypothetical protein ABW220_04535 [Burkholderiaceae bacterium]|jgi:hypothetical protein
MQRAWRPSPPVTRSATHPSQEGNWSIKKVLPAVAPDPRYDDLDGVQDGDAAMQACLEAIAAEVARTIERTMLEEDGAGRA